MLFYTMEVYLYYISNPNPIKIDPANVKDLVLVEGLDSSNLNNTQTNPLLETDGYFYFVLEGAINTSLKISAVDLGE